MKVPRTRPVGPLEVAVLPLDCHEHPGSKVLLATPGADWAQAAGEQFGACGVEVLSPEGRPEARALVCPALHLPEDHPLAAFPRRPGSAQVLALWADGPQQARLLAQGLARLLRGRVDSIDVAGHPATGCRLQVARELVLEAGFQYVEGAPLATARYSLRPDGTIRLPRLDRVREFVDGWVPRPLPPEPTGRLPRTPDVDRA